MGEGGNEKLALKLYVYTLAVFAAMMALNLWSRGAASQELFEIWREVTDYRVRLKEAGDGLRIMLFLDLLFLIGYGGAIGLSAAAHAGRNPVMAWVAGLGIALVVWLDIAENLVMLLSLELAEAGEALAPGRIAWQVGLSGAKWFSAAIAVVALTLLLPRDTGLERLLVWSARVLMPLGAGLFVTDAFGLREIGNLCLLGGMGGGMVLLAVTTARRTKRG